MPNIKDHPEILGKYYCKYAEGEPYVFVFETEQERNDWVNSDTLFVHNEIAELSKMIVTPEQLQALLTFTNGNFEIIEPEEPKMDGTLNEAFMMILILPSFDKEISVPTSAIRKMQEDLSLLHLICGQANLSRENPIEFSPQMIEESFNELEHLFKKYIA